jgi:hypothetical protein
VPAAGVGAGVVAASAGAGVAPLGAGLVIKMESLLAKAGRRAATKLELATRGACHSTHAEKAGGNRR